MQAFMFALVVGSAALALWILVRFAENRPRSLTAAIVHVVAAVVLLEVALPVALSSVSGLPAFRFIDVFALALPLLVYAFLTGGWATQAAIERLRP
jgi:steroid 5-alpha reductase family enzyme